jgi:hypothetical protein
VGNPAEETYCHPDNFIVFQPSAVCQHVIADVAAVQGSSECCAGRLKDPEIGHWEHESEMDPSPQPSPLGLAALALRRQREGRGRSGHSRRAARSRVARFAGLSCQEIGGCLTWFCPNSGRTTGDDG